MNNARVSDAKIGEVCEFTNGQDWVLVAGPLTERDTRWGCDRLMMRLSDGRHIGADSTAPCRIAGPVMNQTRLVLEVRDHKGRAVATYQNDWLGYRDATAHMRSLGRGASMISLEVCWPWL